MESAPTVKPGTANRCAALLAVLVAVAAAAAQGDRHDRQEQLIYSLIVFNGVGYSRTFSAEASGTIYLLAGTDNFLAARKTFVFYRPSEDALKTDTTLLDAALDGVLEISRRYAAPQSLSMQEYTYYRMRADGASQWRTATGQDAHLVYRDYADKLRRYRDGLDAYRLDRATYEHMVTELEKRIEQRSREGGDTARMEEVLRGLGAPDRPEFPDEYATAPERVDRAFVVNLPAGRYRVRLVRRDGKVLEGSEKTIVAFGRFGAPTVGYEVIPGDKWNRPVASHSGDSVIYVDGSSDLYLAAYHQHEFVDLYYEKLLRNDARGSPGLRQHVFVQEVPGVRMAVLGADGPTATVDRRPYFVERMRTTSLAYRIVPFDPEGAHGGREPSLVAFHVDLERYGRHFRVALVDSRGDMIDATLRRVRLLDRPPRAGAVLLLSLLPLAVGIGVAAVRWRNTST